MPIKCITEDINRCRHFYLDSVCPCHYSMARPQPPAMGSNCEYTEQADADRRQGVVPSLGVGGALTTSNSKEYQCYETFNRASDLNGFFVQTNYDKEYGHKIRYTEHSRFV
jgi:hypothetical protein